MFFFFKRAIVYVYDSIFFVYCLIIAFIILIPSIIHPYLLSQKDNQNLKKKKYYQIFQIFANIIFKVSQMILNQFR